MLAVRSLIDSSVPTSPLPCQTSRSSQGSKHNIRSRLRHDKDKLQLPTCIPTRPQFEHKRRERTLLRILRRQIRAPLLCIPPSLEIPIHPLWTTLHPLRNQTTTTTCVATPHRRRPIASCRRGGVLALPTSGSAMAPFLPT